MKASMQKPLAFTSPAPVHTRRIRRASRVPRTLACTAAAGAPPSVAASAITALLSLPAIRRSAMAAGRRKILSDATKIGVDWAGDVALLRSLLPATLQPLHDRLLDSDLRYPEYYLAPFHAYEHGNIGWQPAMEAEVSSRTVHARHAKGAPLAGDQRLRGNALRIIAERWGGAPDAVLDVGCSVGLSAAPLKCRWPHARVVGVDASPQMLAVGALRRPDVEYFHALGERLPPRFEGTFDIVTVQLVVHELPDEPMRAIFAEAKRVLRKGGMLAVMDVDPAAFDEVPALFVALFQSTEPFFEDHKRRDVGFEMEQAGFCRVEYKYNTLNHRTYTAFKQ